MPVKGEWVKEVISLAESKTKSWDEQLTVLAIAYAIGCVNGRVHPDTAFTNIADILKREYEASQSSARPN